MTVVAIQLISYVSAPPNYSGAAIFVLGFIVILVLAVINARRRS